MQSMRRLAAAFSAVVLASCLAPPVVSPALLLLATLTFLGLSGPVPAAKPEIITGAAAVIDGDTSRIGETVVRLYDVDAPELAQTCNGGPPRLRPCGAYAADALAERLAGQEVRCEVLKLDQYDRRVARCKVDGEGLSEWLVASGLAMVFRRYDSRRRKTLVARPALGYGRQTSSRLGNIAQNAGKLPHSKLPTAARSRGTSTGTANASIIRPAAPNGMTEPRSAPTEVNAGSARSGMRWTPAGGRR
jgi:endonuclease YncB( thermonuclease family)